MPETLDQKLMGKTSFEDLLWTKIYKYTTRTKGNDIELYDKVEEFKKTAQEKSKTCQISPYFVAISLDRLTAFGFDLSYGEASQAYELIRGEGNVRREILSFNPLCQMVAFCSDPANNFAYVLAEERE